MAVSTFPHLLGRAQPLADLGWRGRHAEWLTLVCLHSGVFVRAQFCHHYGCSRPSALRLLRRLTGDGIAAESPFPGTRTNQKLCHIHGKALYRALGLRDVRHRRHPSEAVLWRRILSLDAVIERPDLPWLPTEHDKVRYFSGLGIEREILPLRVYPGRGGTTTRYFAWKLPIAGSPSCATFVYCDPGLDTTRQLARWCHEHEPLWAALHAAGLEVHVHAVARTRAAEMRNRTFLTNHTTTPAHHPLSDSEQKQLDEIEAAMFANDQPALRQWGGLIQAARTAGPLRDRADALDRGKAARLDQVRSHVASRVADDAYAA